MSAGGQIYAVGDGGTILYFDGNQWSSHDSGTANILYGVWGVSEADVYAVGDGGTVLRYNGTSWSAMNSFTTQTLRGVWGTAGNNVLVVGGGSTVLRYDGNVNGDWSPENIGATSAAFYSIWGSDANNIFAVGSGGTIINYTSGGWSIPMISSTTQTLYSVWGADADNVIAVGGMGTIVRYNSGLQEWLPMNSPTTQWLYGIYGFDINDVSAFGANGTILFYDGNGQNTWVEVNSPTTEILTSMAGNLGLNPTRLVGENGTILKFTDTWEIETVRLTQVNLMDVWGSSGNEVFTVGGQETILFFDGSQWTEQNYVGNGVTLNDVWGNSGSNVYAVGDGGQIRHYAGASWSTISSGTIANLNGVWVSPNNEVFIVGEQPPSGGTAVILHYTGSNWETQNSGTPNTLNAVWGISENEVFAVGANGTILKYDGNSWSPMNSGTTSTWLTCLWGSSGSDIFAGGFTEIYHFDGNAGNNWTESVNVVEYPNGLWGSSSGNVYAVGGSDQEIIEYFDGDTWGAHYYPAYYPYGIWGSSASNIFVVGSNGMILRYRETTVTHQPNKPTRVAPPNEAVFAENSDITFSSSAFDDPDGVDTHQSTSWKITRDDNGFVVVDIPDSQFLTEYTMTDYLAPGLKYVWQVQHTDNTGLPSLWSDEFAFKVGTPEPDTLPTVPAGKSLGDFGMISIVHWPDNPDPQAVFNISYNPDNYRIGTWDPEQGKYIEFGQGLTMRPGRAHWILTREPLVINFSGIPVSMMENVEVCLHTHPSTKTGWNMIAPPNKARYLWNEVMVGRWLGDDDPLNVSPVPVSNPAASALINHRIWEWKNGGYVDHRLDEAFVLEFYKGYWVKAIVEGAYLVFPEDAQVANLSTPAGIWLALQSKTLQWLKSWVPQTKEAIADNEMPPMPMGLFEDSADPVFEGCFIESAGRGR